VGKDLQTVIAVISIAILILVVLVLLLNGYDLSNILFRKGIVLG